MTQDKQISKDQEIRHQYVRSLVLAGEVILVFPPLAEPLISCSTRRVIYPDFIATERPEQARERTRLTAGGSAVSPVLYSLAFRKAWNKIADDSRTRS